MFTVKDLVKILFEGRGLKEFGYSVHEAIVEPFDLSARDFLAFASGDIEDTSFFEKEVKSIRTEIRRRRVNALGNIKRAIDCRIEELLYCYCLDAKSRHQKWNIPKKIRTLSIIGILAPGILRKISYLRNQLEHEFRMPSVEEVTDALDVAELFLEATERLCYPITHLNKGTDLLIRLDRTEKRVILQEGMETRFLEINAQDDWLVIAKSLVDKRKNVMT